jgi:hypothetical protein
MLSATCHCGAVTVSVPRAPRQLSDCNCSICRRYGVLWAYCKVKDVKVTAKRGTTDEYKWGKTTIRFTRCAHCGCFTHAGLVKTPRPGEKMGVNARTFEPSEIDGVRIRRFDGAKTLKYLD